LTDYYLSKFDSQVNFKWVCTWGGRDWEENPKVAVDSQGNPVVTGGFVGTLDFDPGPGSVELTSASIQNFDVRYSIGDCFLSRFSPQGALIWARSWGGQYSDTADAVAVDGDGCICVAGSFTGTVDFCPGDEMEIHISTALLNRTGTSQDAYIVKFNPDGEW
jgi:hypothetical protein